MKLLKFIIENKSVKETPQEKMHLPETFQMTEQDAARRNSELQAQGAPGRFKLTGKKK